MPGSTSPSGWGSVRSRARLPCASITIAAAESNGDGGNALYRCDRWWETRTIRGSPRNVRCSSSSAA